MFEANGHAFTLRGGFLGAGTFDVGSAGATLTTQTFGTGMEFSGRFTGTGGLTINGPGLVSVYSSGAFATPTNFQSGIIDVRVHDAFSSSAPLTLATGTHLRTHTYGVTVGGLSGSGRITMNTEFENYDRSGFIATVQNTDSTFTGLIEVYGGIVKSGTGTLTLGSDQQFKGSTTINGGTLRTTGSVYLERPFHVGSGGGTIDTAAGTSLQLNIQSSGTGTLIKTGEGKLEFRSSLNIDGDLAINAGTVIIDSPSFWDGSSPAAMSRSRPARC